MKKIAFVSFFVFTLVQISLSQTWTRMQGWGVDLESIYWVNDQKVVVVGENLIIYSEDAGSTWIEVEQKLDFRLFDVVFLNELVGFAVGEKGGILKTTDGGVTWTKIQIGIPSTLKSISLFGEQGLIAVGEDGIMITSQDDGNNWSIVPLNTTFDLHEVFFLNENLGFVAAQAGNIFKTGDKGLTWERIQLNTTLDLNGVFFSGLQNGYAVGDQGILFRSLDGGETWEASVTNVSVNLKKVMASPLDPKVLLAVGDQATIIRSVNSGLSFTPLNLGTGNTRALANLGFKPNSTTLLSIGEDGYIILSTNSGGNWNTRLASFRNEFVSADFKSSTYGFIAGTNGSIFLTNNGAQTLINRSLPESAEIFALEFWNTSYGFVTGAEGEIYRTGNAGTTWVKLATNSSAKIKGLHIFIPEVPYVVGEKGLVARTYSSGNEWQIIQNTNTAEDLNDISAFDLETAFAVGNNGQISWSNNGTVWETIPSFTTENLNFATRLDGYTAIAVGNKGVILKTEDKARTWRRINNPFQQNLNSVDFFDSKFGFAVGESGLTLVTNDGGETWSKINSSTSRDLLSVSAQGQQLAYAVGKDGTILRYSCTPPSLVSEISGNSAECLGTSIYTINSLPEAGSEIVWRVDGGNIISGQGTPTLEVEWTKTGRNAVLVSRVNFCGTGETSALEVLVNQEPSIQSSIEGDGSVCVDTNSTYTIPNQSGLIFSWDVSGGEIISGQGTHTVTIKWISTGAQTVSVVASNVCGKSQIKTKQIQSNRPPDQPAAIQGQTLTLLGEAKYQTVPVDGLNYRWSILGNGKIISGQGTASITVSWESEGEFELSVEAQNECNFGPKRVLPVSVNVITALEPKSLPTDLFVYPNPSQGRVIVESAELGLFEQIEVINSFGKTLHQSLIEKGSIRQEIVDLPSGVHFIRLSGRNGVATKKVIIN